jgi:hypothetical protein
MVSNGRKNIFGQEVRVVEMQSEAALQGYSTWFPDSRRTDNNIYRITGIASDDTEYLQDRR